MHVVGDRRPLHLLAVAAHATGGAHRCARVRARRRRVPGGAGEVNVERERLLRQVAVDAGADPA
jgi:hypothetical protein